MEISTEELNAISVITLTGRLDVTTASTLEKTFIQLQQKDAAKILVDCRLLEYISSAGLRVLLSAAKQTKKSSGEIALACLNANVKQVFEISGFTSIFRIFATKDEAISKL